MRVIFTGKKGDGIHRKSRVQDSLPKIRGGRNERRAKRGVLGPKRGKWVMGSKRGERRGKKGWSCGA